MVTVDMSQDENVSDDADFDLVPPGIYKAKVYEAKWTQNNDGDRDGLNIRFQITEGEQEDQNVFRTYWLPKESELGTEKAGWMVKFLKGFVKKVNPNIDLTGEVEINPVDLTNKPCRIVVEHDEYQGEDQANVEEVKAPSADQFEDGKPEWIPGPDE